jgi:2-phospho-L-lactate guanylyltransferase
MPTRHIHAVVPMKALDQAKSRLAALLSPLERRELAHTMLHDVLTALLQSATETVWVVSADAAVLALARRLGATPLCDTTASLNGALTLAREHMRQAGADTMLVLPADVPLIHADDVAALVPRTTQNRHGYRVDEHMVIAPDRSGRGTNGMGLRLPTPLPFQFGADSLAHHLAAAHALELPTRIYRAPALALDVDTPDDVHTYQMILAEKEPEP